MELRPVTDADLPFLAEMALLAALPPGPLPDGARDAPHVTRWTRDWGRAGDAGVVARSDGSRIGAAWCRVQPDALARDAAGNSVPELAIAVLPEHRARGVGAELLSGLEDVAGRAGHSGLSLTVNARNPAIRLYERAGFEVVRRDGERLTMVKILGEFP